MLVFEELEHISRNQSLGAEKLDLIAGLTVKIAKLGKSSNALKVIYYEKLLNFIRVLCLYLIQKNDFKTILGEKNTNDRLVQSFIDLLYHFGIITLNNDKWFIRPKYNLILNFKKELIDGVFGYNGMPKGVHHNKLFRDFLFVKDIIKKYRNKEYELKYIKTNRDAWAHMLDNGTLDYEVRLAETLFELSRLRIPAKIESPFEENYFTESGRNAFRNFTQYKFIDVFSEIVKKKDRANVLDIGCGYGNYIDVLWSNYPMFHISGIELQEKVFANISEKFKKADNVNIVHGDFFNYASPEKLDVILLNYILFYFNKQKKSDLLSKAKQMLTEDGSIIVCQYFPNIENIKKVLASKQKDLSLSKQIEMFYSNKILYANALWNDSADTFSESVKWDEFMDIVKENNLKINRITNADSFYYSLFIELIPDN